MVKRDPLDDFLDILKAIVLGVAGFMIIKILLQAL